MRPWLITLAVSTLCAAADAQPALDPTALAAEIERQLSRARYMEGKCEPVSIAEWAGFQTQRCVYAVTDKKTGARKQGVVVMLNPSALQLSTWLVHGGLATQCFLSSVDVLPSAHRARPAASACGGCNDKQGRRARLTSVITPSAGIIAR